MREFARSSDAELIAATSRDAEAFGVFYRRHRVWVLSYVARRLREPELAADVTSEIFAAALRGAGSYDARRGAPNSWLFGIASRQVGLALRRGRAEARARRRLEMERVPLETDDVTFIAALAAGQEPLSSLTLSDEVLARVPAEALVLLQSRFVHERSYMDLAGQHRISEATVRKRVSRALAMLRAQLNEGER